MKVSVVIPFYKGHDFLPACLLSLRQSKWPGHMVWNLVIVDNCPIGPPDLSALANAVEVQLIRTRKAIGFGRACNVGVSEAVKRSADVVIILNQDTKVGAHTLARMASFLEEQKHPLTVAAPLLYEYASDLLYPPFVKGELSQNPKLVTDAMAGRLQAAYQVTSISACCLAFKATLFEQLGLFDPHFRHYSEDLYFFDYLHRAGGQAFIISQTKVQHYNSYDQATGQERVRILLLQRNGHALFRKKTGQTYLAFAIRSYAKALLKGYVSSIPQMLRYDWWLFIHRRAISRNSPADIRARIHQWMARDLSV